MRKRRRQLAAGAERDPGPHRSTPQARHRASHGVALLVGVVTAAALLVDGLALPTAQRTALTSFYTSFAGDGWRSRVGWSSYADAQADPVC
jgi:hypothetical protein